jgi:nucleotide-binding universal stress UspA family protein
MSANASNKLPCCKRVKGSVIPAWITLSCIDGSALTQAVCDYAAWIAQRINIPLKLLHTIDHHHEKSTSTDLSGNIGLDTQEHLLQDMVDQEQEHSKMRLQQGKAILNEAKERVIQAGITEPLTRLQHGSLLDALADIEQDIRVLVIGAQYVVRSMQRNHKQPELKLSHQYMLVLYFYHSLVSSHYMMAVKRQIKPSIWLLLAFYIKA